jgi:hypothetical protein
MPCPRKRPKKGLKSPIGDAYFRRGLWGWGEGKIPPPSSFPKDWQLGDCWSRREGRGNDIYM